MVCQGCLEFRAKIDEVDLRNNFKGHEVCYIKQQLKEREYEPHEDPTLEDELELEGLRGRVANLEEEILAAEQELRMRPRFNSEFVD